MVLIKIMMKLRKFFIITIAVCTYMASMGQQAATSRGRNADDEGKVLTENDYFRIQTVLIPQGVLLEVGGMTALSEGSIAVSTRRGEVWIIDNPYMKNGLKPSYRLFAQGLHEPLGLNYIRGDLYLAQRSELTRLRDNDGDGRADQYETMYSWPLSGNYHEYSYGPLLDKDGNMIVALNLGWNGNSESLSKWHGWMLKLSPEFDMTPFATGFRSPAGMALNNEGDLFYSENQGHWVGSGYIAHVAENDFMGNPSGLKWSGEPESNVSLKQADIPDTGEPMFEVAKRVKGIKTPSVWFPHTILGISTSGILSYDEKGGMGPFNGQLFVGDQGHSKIMRVALERVNGVYQGAVFPFREGFSSGILRLIWGADGSMFVGMTSRGWGSTGREQFGLQRLSWTGLTPFEMRDIKVKPDGFELNFTKPVDERSAKDALSYQLSTFTYKYHHEYGSPPINQSDRDIQAIEVSPDKMSVRLVLDSMKLGYIHEIKAEGIRSADGSPLLHNFGYYTLNQLPEGQRLPITDQNRVQKPVMHHHEAPVAEPKSTEEAHKKAPVAPTPKSAERDVIAKRSVKMPASWNNRVDRTITVGTLPGLKFDVENITVKAGSKVKLVFNNNDDMLHNFVLVKPGTADEVGGLALKLGVQGERVDFVPKSDNVLNHTSVLQPGKSEAIYFNAPQTPGVYPYVCTYPGHYTIMRGVMTVTK